MIGSMLRAAFINALVHKPTPQLSASAERLNAVADQVIETRKPMKLGDLIDALAKDRA